MNSGKPLDKWRTRAGIMGRWEKRRPGDRKVRKLRRLWKG
jgi:hypothetical protein